jgi:transcriptional repressor NrdR
LTFAVISYLFCNAFEIANLKHKRGSLTPGIRHSGSKDIMKCPYCGHAKDRVVDSRESRDGDSIRRRRQCLQCSRRFTSYERIDEIPYMVVKKDGGREKFDRNKILSGLMKACEKRPVSLTQLEKIVDLVELRVQESPERELETVAIRSISNSKM